MSVHGKISQFVPSQETWSSYTKRLEYYFIANDVFRIRLRRKPFYLQCAVQLTFRRHVSCHRCGGNHLANVCSFQTAECRACGKIGLIAKVCRSKNRQRLRHPPGGTLKLKTDLLDPQRKLVSTP